MTIKEQFLKEKEELKGKNLIQKASYIFYYHKLFIFIVLVILLIFTTCVIPIITRPKNYLCGVMLNVDNSVNDSLDDLSNDFLLKNNINPKKYCLNIDATFQMSNENKYYLMEILTAKSISNQLDFLTADEKTMVEFAYKNFCADLSSVFTRKQIDKYRKKTIYIDEDKYYEYHKMIDENKNIDNFDFSYSYNSNDFSKSIPVLLKVDNSLFLSRIYNNDSTTVCIGISNNNKKENLVNLLEYFVNTN